MLGGAPALELTYQHSITELLNKPWRDRIKFLKLANVRYIITNKPLHLLPELKKEIIALNPILYRIVEQLPRAWVIGNLNQIRKGSLDELLTDSFDPRYTALTKGQIVKTYNTPYFKEPDHITYSRSGEIRIVCTTDYKAILVLSESSYPGWKVYVDGEQKKCLWLNLLFQGVELEKGSHEITFIFRPDKFNVLVYIQLFFTLLFFIILYLFITKYRKK